MFIFLFVCRNVFSVSNDSLFIEELKEYVFKEIGVELKGEYYVKWSNEKKPFIYVYVSLPDKIESPPGLKSSFIFFGTDEEKAHEKETEFISEGDHTFCYKTYANSAALLNDRFISYSNETKCFIVFHELLHNYLTQEKIKIPYEFNEALSDVIGNYGSMKYSKDTGKISLGLTKHQLCINERLYKSMNSTIEKIKSDPSKTMQVNEKCRRKIQSILKSSDTFQKDRFDYEVNNAYLLKNSYYSRHYFLLKKVLLKQKSIKVLLEVIKNMPEKTVDCVKYLEKYN